MKTTQAKTGEDFSSKKESTTYLSNGNKAVDMEDSALHELFVNELKDIYWAEKHLTKALPKMIRECTSQSLKDAIQSHLNETDEQVMRLEKVFESIKTKASGRKCDAMEGLTTEANSFIDETERGSIVRDIAIICSAQKVEHYEIATYGTLRTLAQVMGHTEAEELLQLTLDEEKNADLKLTGIAQRLNEDALDEKK